MAHHSMPPKNDVERATLESGDRGKGRTAAEIERAVAKAKLFSTAAPRIGRYRIVDVVGEGGMGTVYAAVDEELGRRIAIKQLKAGAADDDNDRRRILREAQGLAQLSHPNVVPVYESGVSDGQLYFAMEFIEGVTLKTWAEEEKRSWSELVLKYLQAGRGLVAAHAVGLVHRDFKPHNAVVGIDGRVRVLDFGLAVRPKNSRVSEPNEATPRHLDSEITRTGAVVGTPAYMAPEQLRGETVDARADQFSFCVSLYEALCGKRPFTPARLLEGPGVEVPDGKGPRALWRILGRGLALDPNARFPSMNALVVALERVLGRRRRVTVGATVVGAALASALVGARYRELPCAGPFDVGTAWDQTRSSRVQSAFVATELPFASLAYRRTARRLDQWAEDWAMATAQTCEATHVEGTQSEAQLDRRVACLEGQRRVVSTRIGVLEEASPTVVGRVDEVLRGLPDVAACVDVSQPLSDVAISGHELLDVEASLERGRVFADIRDPNRAEASLQVARRALRGAAQPRLEIVADALEAQIVSSRGNVEDGSRRIAAAARRAYALRLDELVASLRVRRAGMVAGQLPGAEQRAQIIEDARAALDRVGRSNDPRRLRLRIAEAQEELAIGELDAALAGFEDVRREAASVSFPALEVQARGEAAAVKLERGDVSIAIAEYREVLRSVDAQFGASSPRAATVHYNLGIAHVESGDLESADAELDRARSLFVRVEGSEGLDVARVDFARVKVAMERGDLELGRTLLEKLLPVLESVEPYAFSTVNAYNAMGVLAYFEGDFEASIAAYRRALALDSRSTPSARVDQALTRSNIGESMLALGRTEEALQLFDDALATMRAYLTREDEALALPYKGRGLARLRLGRRDTAAVDLREALRLLELNGGERLELAAVRFGLAKALWATDPESARTLAKRALDDFDELELPEQSEPIREWLVTHESRQGNVIR